MIKCNYGKDNVFYIQCPTKERAQKELLHRAFDDKCIGFAMYKQLIQVENPTRDDYKQHAIDRAKIISERIKRLQERRV